MLTDNSKQVLRAFIAHTKDRGMIEAVSRKGPAFTIDKMLEKQFLGPAQHGAVLTPDYYEDLKAHRQEAEQYLAGMLGMC